MEIIEVKNDGWSNDLLRVDVAIGNICNYKCWYCWPESHAGNIKWPDFDSYVKNLSHLLDYYLENSEKKRFDITLMGGEVTHWKRFTDLIKYFKERYDCIFTLTTNASKKISWWQDAYKYLDYVNISVHHEFSDPNHLKDVADFLYEKNVYLVTLVLMDPLAWDKCTDIVDTLKTSKHRWTIKQMPIVEHGDIKIVYTDEQKNVLNTLRARKPNIWYYWRSNKSYKSKVKVIDTNNKKHSFEDNEILRRVFTEESSRKLNNFKGWECDVGVHWIAIKSNGQISGICNNGLYDEGKTYNLNDVDFKTTFRPKITPTICEQAACWCGFETDMPKRKL